MEGTRAPVVAGTFYPGERDVLARTVGELLAAAPPGPAPKAIVVPHAGYVYSGAVAAAVWKRVSPAIERIVLVGPAHRVYCDELVWPGVARMRTPLGDVEIDTAACAAIAAHPAAHAREHSLEVELPFIQTVLPAAKVVPLVISRGAVELDPLWGGPETLIAISTDLSHHLPYDRARAIDARTAARILACEPVEDEGACGASALNGLLAIARRKHMRVEQVDLRNSGDTAGDKSRVVGYGAFAFYEAKA